MGLEGGTGVPCGMGIVLEVCKRCHKGGEGHMRVQCRLRRVRKMYCTQLRGYMGLKCGSGRACAQELQHKCRRARETCPSDLGPSLPDSPLPCIGNGNHVTTAEWSQLSQMSLPQE